MAVQSQQIDLLFGVKGGGTVNGESGQRIQSQINGIVSGLKEAEIKVDYTAVTKAAEQLEQLSKQITAINSCAVKIKAEGVGADLGDVESKNPLSAITIKVDSSELDRVENQLKRIQKLITSMPELAVGKDLERELSKAYKSAKSIYSKFLGNEQKFASIDVDLDNEDIREAISLRERLIALSENFTDSDGIIIGKGAFDDKAKASFEEFERVYSKYVSKLNAGVASTKAATQANKKNTTELMNGRVMLNKLYKSYDSFKNIKDYPEMIEKYNSLVAKIKNSRKDDNGNLLISSEEVKKLKTDINEFENACYEAGVQADTFGEAIEHKIGDRIKYLIGQFAIDFVVQGLRRIYDNVLQIDAAMTELKKVTDETDEVYDRFLTNASQRAKELGASLVEVIQMTSDYARLGYNVDEASKLADAAIIYKNVGDGLRDTDEATDHLISTMNAFGIAAEDSMRIVDAFNEVSNNFAVTSSDIGAGLQRSSAAMAVAGNSMEETIALFTAGNTIVRDADTMGRICPAA